MAGEALQQLPGQDVPVPTEVNKIQELLVTN